MADGEHLLVGVHRQHHDLDLGQGRADLPGGLDAVDLGHRDVHQDDLGPQLVGQADGLLAVTGLTDHVEALVDHRPTEPFAQHAMVVGQHQADAHGCPLETRDAGPSGPGAPPAYWSGQAPVADGRGPPGRCTVVDAPALHGGGCSRTATRRTVEPTPPPFF